MSASLVGSEMCIRDRRWLSSPLFPPHAVPATRALALAGLCDRLAGGGAVSYTHLTLPTICSV
eukprot:4881601-Alexandrium_andersonii.AAC.1